MFPEGTTTNGRALIKFKPGEYGQSLPSVFSWCTVCSCLYKSHRNEWHESFKGVAGDCFAAGWLTTLLSKELLILIPVSPLCLTFSFPSHCFRCLPCWSPGPTCSVALPQPSGEWSQVDLPCWTLHFDFIFTASTPQKHTDINMADLILAALSH